MEYAKDFFFENKYCFGTEFYIQSQNREWH
jgi:hypothetical protein